MHNKKTTGLVSALVVLGFTTILTQLVFIREFLNIFQGNELVIGLIICIWMLSTAAGSRLWNRVIQNSEAYSAIRWYFILHGILTFVAVAPLTLIESFIVKPGVAKGFMEAFLYCSVLLLPYCTASGFIFSAISGVLSFSEAKNRVAYAFGWESSGSVLAGILYSIGMMYLLDTGRLLSLIFVIDLLLFLLMTYYAGKAGWLISLSVLVFIIVLLFIPVNKLIQNSIPVGHRPIYSRYTPYGKISVTSTYGQYNIFENGNLFLSSQNHRVSEEAVHFALLQRDAPSDVLVVSGGITGITKEVLKYPSVKRIDYIEINPWLISTERSLTRQETPTSVTIIYKDARTWIAQSLSVYDAVVLVSPDPVNAQINRYFTKEFFEETAIALKPGGVFELSLGSTANYMSNEDAEINGILYSTLKSVFDVVIIVQGEKNYFLASDLPLYMDIANRSKIAGMNNEYVNEYFIDDELFACNNQSLMKQIEISSYRVNSDLIPFAYLGQIKSWLSKSEGYQRQILVFIPVVITLVVVWLLLRKSVNRFYFGIFTGAFAGASSEFVLLILFQVVFGFVYQMLGLIFGLYMAGLAAGSLIRIHSFKINRYLYSQIILMLLVLLIPVIAIISSLGIHHGILFQIIICCAISAIAFFSGLVFNMASMNKTNPHAAASNVYGIDLAGAALGSIITSLVCLPLLGLILTCIISAVIIMMSIIILFLQRRKPENG